MKIIAGGVEIPIKDMPYWTTASVEGKTRDCYKITIEGSITDEQLNALSNYAWEAYDGEHMIGTYSGYDTPIDHKITFARVETKQEEIDAALKPVLDYLSDEEALNFVTLYPLWSVGKVYLTDTRIKYDDILYKCITEHISQAQWTPDKSPSLWARVLVSTEGDILEWTQPDSTNAYMTGDKVIHNDKTWVSDIDNNVWEPGVYGWSEVVDEVIDEETTEETAEELDGDINNVEEEVTNE